MRKQFLLKVLSSCQQNWILRSTVVNQCYHRFPLVVLLLLFHFHFSSIKFQVHFATDATHVLTFATSSFGLFPVNLRSPPPPMFLAVEFIFAFVLETWKWDAITRKVHFMVVLANRSELSMRSERSTAAVSVLLSPALGLPFEKSSV